jgi:hypothetical protein
LERDAESLAAGRRADSIFRELIREYPDQFEYAYQLTLIQEEFGLHFNAAERWPEAIRSFEAVRQTLKDMAARHGTLASRMCDIQERIAAADINLREVYAKDPQRTRHPAGRSPQKRMRSARSYHSSAPSRGTSRLPGP